ncbi:putative histidine triad nucleotide binding protein [Botrytis fragariae]|uniref:Aprataxin-like protein n=1 Tax=Botrytis fragariae TaxID=1964551 RepID=A0A8H6ELX9_9HELO|nr:putative histidine triad nucleotide binding protein [Botrytis fragariae]KAF5877112.1 putative histidine triad nucleotide binding protein [Botrytis fragariae]
MTSKIEEDTNGTPQASSSSNKNSSKPNAFTELMSSSRSKRPNSSPTSSPPPKKIANSNPFHFGRAGLGAYLSDPSSHPASLMIYHNSSFVAIHDLYPKSSVHALLIPREEKWNSMHPRIALSNPEFLEMVRPEAEKLKGIVASELRRKYGPESAEDLQRQKILNGEVNLDDDAEMPEGRNWEKDIMIGIHMHPSMDHLHIHVLSVDRYSSCLKKRKHYNSFATPFFVHLSEFPLSEERQEALDRKGQGKAWLEDNLKCWRCGMQFGNKFARLKQHLELEFDEWKKQ